MHNNTVTTFVKNLGGVISRNSPIILTGVAVTGLISSVGLGIKATPKALLLIEEEIRRNKETLNRTPTLTKIEIIKIAWRPYVHCIISGAISIGCIIAAHRVNYRRNAALASLYSISEAAFKEYQTKIVETIGKNKELKVRDDISADKIKANPKLSNEVILTGKGDVLCYDSMSGRYFRGELENLRRVQNELNRRLMSEMYISLNEMYAAINLDGIELGRNCGWFVEKGYLEFSFSAHLTEEEEPCVVLNYEVEPYLNR